MIEADGRCHSWRPGTRPHTPRHVPGRCHRCWRPCWAKVPRDGHTVRCDECIDAILRLNTARLTRMLLEEPYVPERLSERLVSDLDAGVALAASERLGGQLAGAAGQLAGAAGQLAGAAGQLAGAAGQLAGAAATSASTIGGESIDASWAATRDDDVTDDFFLGDASSAFDPTAEMAPVDVTPPAPSWDNVPTSERSVGAQGAGQASDQSDAMSDDWATW